MKTAYFTMTFLAVLLLIMAFFIDSSLPLKGMKSAFFFLMKIFPILLLAFFIVGMIQVLLPQEFIMKWVGEEAGLRGILIGSVAGALTPGGPFVCFPIAASIFKAGAGIGTVVAYVSAWCLLSVTRLPYEMTFLGFKLSMIRVLVTLVFPPLAGLIAYAVFSK